MGCACMFLCWLLFWLLDPTMLLDGLTFRDSALLSSLREYQVLIKSSVALWTLSTFLLTKECYFLLQRHSWCEVILVSNDLSCILSISFLPDSLTFWKCIWKISHFCKATFQKPCLIWKIQMEGRWLYLILNMFS